MPVRTRNSRVRDREQWVHGAWNSHAQGFVACVQPEESLKCVCVHSDNSKHVLEQIGRDER